MSDDRKILVAKRQKERNKFTNSTDNFKSKQESSNFRKGVKRPIPPTPKKNLANDRLKKLRTSLNDEIQNCCNPLKPAMTNTIASKTQQKISNTPRKRLQDAESQDVYVPKKIVCELETDVSKSVSEHFTEGSVNQSSFTTSIQNTVTISQSDEAMEWSSTDVEMQRNPCNSSNSNIDYNKPNNEILSNKKDFFIIVDTNIFISQLPLIKNIIGMSIAGEKKPIIFIPWIVIEELDFIKEDSNKGTVRSKTQDAIKYIEKNLSDKNERIMGQTLKEAGEQESTGKSQDNKIIGCCFQILEKYENMVLLTNDVNLRNKARINHIPVCSHKEIMSKIKVTLSSNRKSQIILEKMTSLCCTIIHECALQAYGKTCYKMEICQNTPKSLQDSLNIFSKYWFPVFQEVLMKQFQKLIDDLSIFLSNHESIKDGSKEMNDLLNLCIKACVFFKDVESCKSTTENTMRDLNDMKET